MAFLTHLFDPSGFPARWQCGSGWAQTPWLGWLHILSDLGVWSAYVAIPFVLIYFLMRRKDLPFRKIFLLFGAFILACGTTHLMEAMHGGTVTAHSEGAGRRSEFTVQLPVIEEDSSKPTNQVTRDQPSRSASKQKILVVDDNVDGAQSLAMMLRMLGNETRMAHDGLEAVEAAGEFLPDVILLDIGLPKLNGYDACRRIREQEWSKQTLIIALTGWGQDKDREQSGEAGFDHHLVKPVDLTALQDLLAAPHQK